MKRLIKQLLTDVKTTLPEDKWHRVLWHYYFNRRLLVQCSEVFFSHAVSSVLADCKCAQPNSYWLFSAAERWIGVELVSSPSLFRWLNHFACLALQGTHQHSVSALLGFVLNGVCVCACVPSSHIRMFYVIQLDGAEAGCLPLHIEQIRCSLSSSTHTFVSCGYTWKKTESLTFQ